MSVMINSITHLKLIQVSLLSIEDKVKIKALGRPTPPLTLTQKSTVKGKEQTITSNVKTYERNSWICGCTDSNLLFCFPCTLFNAGDEAWTKRGVGDLVHLTQKIKKHEESMSHKNAFINLSVIGKVQRAELLSDSYRRNVEIQNEKIGKNRYILSKIIDCIKFCGAFELALRGHYESADSVNPGIFRGLVNFTSTIDDILKEHLKTSKVFQGTYFQGYSK